MKPYDTAPGFVDEVVGKATRKMTELGYIWGTSQQVAAQLQAYVDAGVDWISPVDYLPIVSDPAEGAASLTRAIEICSIVKGFSAAV
jgi:phthiodiolone/phenolphthiodiolone dimycocerosates ketoreductase